LSFPPQEIGVVMVHKAGMYRGIHPQGSIP